MDWDGAGEHGEYGASESGPAAGVGDDGSDVCHQGGGHVETEASGGAWSASAAACLSSYSGSDSGVLGDEGLDGKCELMRLIVECSWRPHAVMVAPSTSNRFAVCRVKLRWSGLRMRGSLTWPHSLVKVRLIDA